MSEYRRHSFSHLHHRGDGFWRIYFISIIFTFHTLLVAYINSSYMESYLSPEGVSALFSIGSAIAVIAFLFISHVLRAIGNIKLTVALAILDIVTLIVMGITAHQATAIIAFVTFLIVNPLLFLNIDIFAESITGNNESYTGSRRGLTLTLKSLAAVCAPLTMGLIIDGGDNLSPVYFTAAGVFLIFIIFIFIKFNSFEDPHYHHLKMRDSIYDLWKKSDMRNVLLAHLTLQMFFVWAVIYIPLYLSTEIGFTWDTISYIISVGLFAYVLLEWPIGLLADKVMGEKELMALGFLILAVSSSYISFMGHTNIIAWMLLVFMTRVGAALVETTTESYFFKHTHAEDAEVISFFRLMRPLSMLIGSILGSVALFYLPFNLIFVVLALLMIPGIFFTMALKDTK